MPKKGANINLKGYDDLFSTEESRAEAQQERVQEIPLSELHPFEGHPFRVVDDEEMAKTVESVKEYGVLTPAIVRPDPYGGYEIISGHRRHHASELAGKETMPVIVRDLDDDAAIILMVDSNLQRETLLPSERAFAYAVVNNNIENPSVIEFGEGVNQLIDDILKVESNPHIIYNNPTEVYSANVKARTVNASSDLYDYYPVLEEANYAAVAQLAQLRQFVQSDASVCSDGDYGFIDWGDMPSGTYDWDMVANAASTDWATTGEFSSIAKNHCGATAVTNFALYFANCGYSNLKINSSVYDTFVAVHKIVGNGPVMTIADEAKEYFTDRGYTLKTSSVGSFSGIQTAIGNDRPCGILLANAIVDWHWVICVGYRAYNSGGSYMRVVDGWNDTTLKFYLCNSGSTWISATQYWVA